MIYYTVVDGQIWINARDLADVLGYARVDSLLRLVSPHNKTKLISESYYITPEGACEVAARSRRVACRGLTAWAKTLESDHAAL